jgi:hypothetical protein
MTDYHFLNIALGICMNVYENASRHISKLEAGIAVGNVDDSHADVNLILKQMECKTTFAVVSVEVTELEMETKKLLIEVFAKKEERELGGVHFDDNIVHSILRDYEEIRPGVKESLLHSKGAGKSQENIARELEISFKVFAEAYEITDDFTYEYDENEIGGAAVPYVTALHEIHSKLHLKDEIGQ